MSNDVKVIIPRNEIVFVDKNGDVMFSKGLQPEEKLVEIGKYNDFVNPMYDENLFEFIESATKEEIERFKNRFLAK